MLNFKGCLLGICIIVVMRNTVFAEESGTFVKPIDLIKANTTNGTKIESTIINQALQNVDNLVANDKAVYLDGIDNTADDLIKLKRKLELEKAEAELRKLRSGSDVSGLINSSAQTIVTGVAINNEGHKIAWLQFADGGSISVNIGSQIGRYTVSDISMNGVYLSHSNGKKKLVHKVLLKRMYPPLERPLTNNSVYSPSPVVTNANTGSINDTGSEMVPPILPLR